MDILLIYLFLQQTNFEASIKFALITHMMSCDQWIENLCKFNKVEQNVLSVYQLTILQQHSLKYAQIIDK
jgi:hypothetical protein